MASPEPETSVEAATTNTSVSVPLTNVATGVSPTNTAAPPPPFADLKLQSIIFRVEKPAALVNGEMVFVGDSIRGARIVKIELQSVTVERNGETHELRLPRL